MHAEMSPVPRPPGSSCAARIFTLVVAACALLAAPAVFAQASFTVGTNLVDLSRAKGNETDPCVAISPLNRSNMVVAAATDGKVPGLFFAFTTNMGGAWKTNFIATNSDSQGLIPAYGEPSVAWDSHGNLFLAYLPYSFEGVAVAVSTNGGSNFVSLTNLAALDVTDTPRLSAPPSGAAAGSVWIVYKDYTSANTPLQVQGMLSTGLGAMGTFSVPQIVPDSTYGGFPDIAAGPLGELIVAFQDNLTGLFYPGYPHPPADIWVAIETNAIPDGVISEHGFDMAGYLVSDAISGLTYIDAAPTGIGVNAAAGLAFDYDINDTNYDHVYLIYTAMGPNGNLVINLLTGIDRGTNWIAETYVDDDVTNGFNDHFLPRVAVDPSTGIIGCSWYDCRNDQGAASQQLTNVIDDTFTFSGLMVTNVDFADSVPELSETWTDATGGGTNITIVIVANNASATLMTSKATNIYIYSPGHTNFVVSLAATNTGSGTAMVTVILTNMFPLAYTSGSATNQEAVMYTTLSLDGAKTFLPNQQLTSPNGGVPPPAVGLASDVAGSGSLTGWGHYSGLAAYGANFFPVWADNSDMTVNNPDGANANFDIYMVSSASNQPSISVPTADLSIWVTNSPNPVISEGVLLYSVIVTNHGPVTAKPVIVTNILSTNVTLVSATPALGGTTAIEFTTNGQEEVVFTWPSLAPNKVLSSTIRVTASTSSIDTNIATVYSPYYDLVPTNNTNILVVVIDGQDLAMGMTASETNVLIGDTVVSWITVTNLGPATNGPVFITNYFSPNWTNITVQAQGTNLVTNNSSGPMVIVDLGLLPVGQPVTATFLAVAVSGGASAWESNCVTSQDVDTNLANNSAAISYFVNGEDLAIGMTESSTNMDQGQPITYTIEVTNIGLSYSGLVTVSNNLSPNLYPLSTTQSQGSSAIVSHQVIFNLGVLPAGQIASMTITAIGVGGPPSAANIASVSSTDFDRNLDNNGITNFITFNGEDLSVALSASPPSLQVGQTVTYTEHVTNLGPSTNGVVLVTNTFSANLGSITVLPPTTNYTISNDVVIINLGTLNTGQTVPITVTAIPTSAGIGLNTVGVGSQDFDTNLGNNTANALVTITPTLPIINNLAVTPLASGAIISWDTVFPATAQVRYGIIPNDSNFSTVSSAASTQHVVLLTGLAGGTNYDFEVLSWVGSTLYTTNGSFSTTNTLILNTKDAKYTGVWTAASVATGIYGTYYQYSTTTVFNASAWALYDPYIPASGLYNVYIWYPQNNTFTTNAQVHVTGATNAIVLSVNQTIQGGGWQPLATNMYFAAGTNGNVILYNNTGDTNKYLVANAMKWVYNAAQDYASHGAVPAWWANFYFGTNVDGSVSGSADADNDGYSNYAEYVFGTDPTDAASHLNFSVSPVSSNVVAVTFSPCQGGRAYQLLAATDLASPLWTTLTNAFTQNTNGSGTFTVTQTNAAAAFYRLSAQIIP
jgi:uncharacterized repeat protein (TIGR01451 family)